MTVIWHDMVVLKTFAILNEPSSQALISGQNSKNKG